MYENIKLKSLLIISLLVFMLPFFQTCSDQTIRENICNLRSVALPVEDSLNSIEAQNLNNDISEVTEKEVKKSSSEEIECLRENRKHYTYNAYYIGFNHFLNFEYENFLDRTFYMFSIYTIIIFITFFMLAFAFIINIKSVYILSIVNFILALIWLLALPLFDLIKEFNQIKYGYYLFLFNSILIIFESKKVLDKSKIRI